MSQQSSLRGEMDAHPPLVTQVIQWIRKGKGSPSTKSTSHALSRISGLSNLEEDLPFWEGEEEIADTIEVVSSPTKTLQGLLTKIIEWIGKTESKSVLEEIPCLISDIRIVHDHASTLCADSILGMCRNVYLKRDWKIRYSYENVEKVDKLVMAFLQSLNKVFKVPELKPEDDNDKHVNVLMALCLCCTMPFFLNLLKMRGVDSPSRPILSMQRAAFMDFLLQLLIGKRHLFSSADNLLIKELRSFITIFLDTPFLATEDEQVRSLLSQFDTLANTAGSLVHSFIFSRNPPYKKLDKILMEPVILLNANVVEFFNSSTCKSTPKTVNCAMSSVFIVDSFLYDLENLINSADDRIAEVKCHVEMLHQSLKHLWPLLKEHPDQKDDVKEIVLLAYDAEYLINYFLTGDASAWYLNIRLPSIVRNVELVAIRLQQILKGEDDGWCAKVDENNSDVQSSLQPAGVNYGVDDTIVGFEDLELKILEELVGGRESLQIISIFGMPGIGKTTLAKRLYDHPTIRYSFDKCSWCAISQMYKRKKVLVDILMGLQCGVENATIEKMDDDRVGERIYKSLKGRRYVIVMDDIWELNVWEDIEKYFPNDRNGSRILFTSRSKGVSPCSCTIHELPVLSNDQCWELLKNKVFCNETCPLELQHIGKKIATNCSGLPLAVVVVAGILSTMKKDLSDWENVRLTLDSNILSYQDNVVAKTLELSYIHLPQHLKPCFLYLGKFEEDEAIHVKTLMQLWIAEGFIPVDEKKRAENIAEEYLKQLVDKSLVTIVKTNSGGQAKVCVIHDLLRDMCLNIIKEESFFLKLMDPDWAMCNHKFHRILCHSSSNDIRPYGPHVRSFFFCDVPQDQVLSLNVHNMKVLRALDCRINGRNVDCDLVGFQNLIHLRYLAVKRIRTPIGSFSSLEFLIIEHTVNISSIISGMRKLRYLRAFMVFLDINCNTSEPNNLEFLSMVQISQEKGEKWLKQSPHLRRLKCLYSTCTNEGGTKSDLSFFTQLESLTVSASVSSGITEIKFPLNIKKLHLSCFKWSWEIMSIIGVLPNLEVLKLGYKMFVGKKWETRDDEFQQLKYLELSTISDLVEWNVSSWEHFPKLQRLILRYCGHLKEIPGEIGEIPTLQLIEVYGCRESVVDSIKQIQQQLEEEGNEDHLRIVIQDTI